MQTNVLDGGKGSKGLCKVVLLKISVQRRSVPVVQFPFGDQEKAKMTSYPNAQINEKCWISWQMSKPSLPHWVNSGTYVKNQDQMGLKRYLHSSGICLCVYIYMAVLSYIGKNHHFIFFFKHKILNIHKIDWIVKWIPCANHLASTIIILLHIYFYSFPIPYSILFKFFDIKFAYIKFTCTLYRIQLCQFWQLWNHCQDQDRKQFLHPKKTPSCCTFVVNLSSHS